jgi:2-polyprenyl-3-methyl-5-hydroxy-6-metoxy-1,4-benzoquinol methylase
MSALQSTVAQPQPTPELFFQTVQSYHKTFVLKTAVELELFTAIAAGSHTVPEIAKACSVPERGVRVLCDCLTVMGFLTKASNRYSLTPDSATFLDRRSPAYLGNSVRFLLDPRQVEKVQRLTESVRKGMAADTSALQPDDPLWVEFARGMAPFMVPAAQAIAQSLRPALASRSNAKVLDIAAGHGTFGITVAEHFPSVHVYALDWANVLQVAKENAVSHGVDARHHLVPGSAFEVNWGTGYDAVLLTNFLHHFSEEACAGLLRKAHAALAPGGQVVILEFVPDEDRVSPPIPAMFSLVMFSGTPEGDAYTFTQLSQMCRQAGFAEPRLEAVNGLPEAIIIAKKTA